MTTTLLVQTRAAAHRRPAARLGAMLLALAWAGCAAAQQGPPNALQGFSQNRNQPIKIESVSLEVRDKDKVATFIDNVKLTQGDTTLECKRLIVHYMDETIPGRGKGKPPAKNAPAPAAKKGTAVATGGFGSGQQQISKLEAKGGVVVTQKDQTATGENGIYDMKSNTLVLTGNVVVSQGQNVVRGDRLVVDMTSGASRVESSGSGKGRVQGLFIPGTTPTAPADTKPHSGEPERNQRPRSGGSRPLKLN
jgi:lipopolysaccharide export system protein LptA